MNTKFSVLLSLYNEEQPAFLAQALKSVFEQTYPPTEVVLVLDGNITAELQETVDNFKQQYPAILKIVPLEKNVGLGPALNEGLKYCSYELVARMDTDDICKLDRFEKQVKLFEQNPQIDITSSWTDEFYDSTDEIVSARKLPETHAELKKWAKSRSPMNHPAVMYKKSKVELCGGYESLGLFEDYILWMKMLQNNAIFYNIQESLLYFRSNKNMYKRRGGFNYALNECNLQWLFYKRKMINLPVAVKNIIIRFGVRLVPNKLRAYIYKKFLR
ncbi:MAG: glycosyltransferase [Prevotellaceae bacterium]|jgi:glycosyltransferase involved in cell wall biosynthesis|nr:glycosyltransferase [Prevotellaceae bacterium]